MKLLLYQTAGSGPISVALVKGQRFRILPPPLAGCAKALLWTWDGIGVNGLGGKFEGTLVDGSILLHCVNSLLKHNALLIQPYSKAYSGRPVERNVPLPLCEDDSSVHPSILQTTKELALQTCSGYIRLVQVPRGEVDWDWVPLSVEFGVPLFDTELCRSVCRNVIQAHLFSNGSLMEHRQRMHELRRRLQEFIMDYQAAGNNRNGSGEVSRPKSFDEEGSDVPLPGSNLIFNGAFLEPLHVDRCLQGRLPARLVVAASASTKTVRVMY